MPKRKHHIVQTAFKKLEKHLAGDTLGAGSLVEKIAEIFLEHTIGIFSLLLLTQLSAILRSLAATVLAVLARSVVFFSEHLVFTEDGLAELTGDSCLGAGISCHFVVLL